jgi:integrase
MPPRAKPPRLYLRRRSGRGSVWVIRDGGHESSTAAPAADRGAAEKALADYIGRKHRPDFGRGDPHHVKIADVLAEYAEKRGPKTRRGDLIDAAAGKLDEFFGERTVATITAGACDEYVAWRTAQTDARAKSGGRPIKEGSARRELGVLLAATRWCWKEGKLDRPIAVSMPPQGDPRERHLTRTEAATLLAAALGWHRGPDGRWRRNHARINRHLARFILIGLYTGTRHDAILRLQWLPNTEGGWIDLDARVLHRRPQAAKDKGKRRPALPVPPRLLPHLARWKRLTARFVIEWMGKPIASQERRAFAGARALAGLGPDVTPHVLRHTCATWLLQRGVSVYDVAGVIGASENVVRRTYGHHAQDHLRAAVAAFSRAPA